MEATSEILNLSKLKSKDIKVAILSFTVYSQNTRTFPLPVLKLVLYFSNIASISETRSVIL